MDSCQIKPCNILYWLKPLYLMSKCVGLAPFRLTVDLLICEDVKEDDLKCNLRYFIWPAIVFAVILMGFIDCVSHLHLHSSNPGCIAHMLTLPLTYITALVTMISTITVNRHNVIKLTRMLCKIDSVLLFGKCKGIYKKARFYLILEISVLFLVVVPFMAYDSYLWDTWTNTSYVFEIITRVSTLINLVIIVQFVNVVHFIKHRLKMLNKLFRDNQIMNALENNLQPCDITDSMKEFMTLGNFTRFRSKLKESIIQRKNRIGSENLKKIKKNIFKSSRRIKVARVLSACKDDRNNLPSLSIIFANDKHLNVAQILKLRIVYKFLYETLKLVNSIYGLPILLLVTFCFGGTVSNIYAILDSLLGSGTKAMAPSYIIWMVVLSGSATAICASSHFAQIEAKKTVDEIQTDLLQNPLKKSVCKQLKLFSSQISKNPIEITGYGFFSVNLSLLFTFIGSATTYTIILVQFKLNK